MYMYMYRFNINNIEKCPQPSLLIGFTKSVIIYYIIYIYIYAYVCRGRERERYDLAYSLYSSQDSIRYMYVHIEH